MLLRILCSGVVSYAWTNQSNDVMRYIVHEGIDSCMDSNKYSCTCLGHCNSLQYALTHQEVFFTSNTTIRVMPGQYIVNQSFGIIRIENIKLLTITGKDSHNSTTIYCTRFGTLGFHFLNVSNVTLSSIHFSQCTGDKSIEKSIPLLDHVYFDHFSDFYKLLKFTIAFVTSSNISVSNVTVDQAAGIGLIDFGTSNHFQLSHSVFYHNKVNFMISTEVLRHYSTHDIVYTITDSWFGYGNASQKDFIASGISVILAHISNEFCIRLLLSKVTLFNNRAQQGNLMFASVSNCLQHIGQIVVAIYDTVSEMTGDYSNKGLVMSNFNYCNTGHSDISILTMDNCKFLQSSMEVSANVEYLLLKDIEVRRVSCTSKYALSLFLNQMPSCTRYNIALPEHTVQNLSIVNSCGYDMLTKITSCTLKFQGNNIFCNNSGTVRIYNSAITFTGNTTFSNSRSHESPIRFEDTSLYITGEVSVENNSGGQCGGITLIRSDMTLSSVAKLTFIDNQGYNGGALALYDESQLFTKIRTFVVFENNLALHYGGGIFVDDSSYRIAKYSNRIVLNCFSFGQFRTSFKNNTAKLSGNALYGGWLDFCTQILSIIQITQRNHTVFNELHITYEELSLVSSSPSRVCLCINSTPQCDITHYKYEQPLSPGQSFKIHAVAVGQRFGTVPSTVIAEFINASVKIDDVQQVQKVGRNCTTLNYTVKSPNEEEILLLKVERNFVPEPDSSSPIFAALQKIPYYKEQMIVFVQHTIALTISKCPLGYSYDSFSKTCTCLETLTKHGIECHLQNQTVIRTNQMWINATFIHTDSEIGNPGVVVHQHCPFDYCKNLDQQYLDLQYPDDQCDFGRSGVLCGECPQNYSHVFGTSKCKQCSNVWTLLVVPLFILTGIGLIALLIILDLTVSIGTINGLIFYAHIVRANQASFFPPQMTNNFLSWFIAWLNLDLGVEMCFFDGLDAYIKTWLQFLFPLYIWIMVIVIIVSSHYYTFAARLSGTNAVQVLATLFLMSYAKMLRIKITILSSTSLEYPDGHMNKVWLYDGNVNYLKGKHIPLFIAALILLIFLSIPYTIVLLCIQWLRLLPSYRILFWVRKLKPLFDAYTGVYKRQHGYWTGLLLLVRVGLFLVFAVNVLGDPSINLLAVAATTFCLFAYLAMFGGVYRQRSLNLTEVSFLLNLGILSTATLYTRLEDYNQEKVTTVSVGIVLSTFVLIVFYHAYQRLKSTHRGGLFIKHVHKNLLFPMLNKFKTTKDTITASTTQLPKSRVVPAKPTQSLIDLREPLLTDVY